MLIKALEKVRGKQKLELSQWLSAKKFNAAKKVKGVTQIYNALNIPAITEKKIEEYFQQGFTSLSRVSGDTQWLEAFTKDLIARQA